VPSLLPCLKRTIPSQSTAVAMLMLAFFIAAFALPGKAQAQKAYVPQATGAISVINLATNALCTPSTCVSGATYPISVTTSALTGVAVLPNGTAAYIADATANKVYVINTATDTVSATITVSSNPSYIVASPDGQHVYAAVTTGTSTFGVAVISTATNTVTSTIAIPSTYSFSIISGLVASTDGSEIYVAGATVLDGGAMFIYSAAPGASTATFVNELAGGSLDGISPTGSTLYIYTSAGFGAVSTAAGATPTYVSSTAGGQMVISADGATGYIARSSGLEVVNLASLSVTTTVSISNTLYVALSPNGNTVYVTSGTTSAPTVTPVLAASDSALTAISLPASSGPEGIGIQPGNLDKQLGNNNCGCGSAADASGSVNSTGGASAGEPIDIGSGNMAYSIPDYTTAGPDPLAFTRYYNSLGTGVKTYAVSLGPNWRTNYDRYIQIGSYTAVVERPSGQQLLFSLVGSVWTPDTDVDATLTLSGSTWTFKDHNDTVETYTANTAGNEALLQTITLRNGYTQTMHYTSSQLTSVTDSYSRALTITYSGTQLSTMTTPESNAFTYAYNSNGTLAWMASPIDHPGGVTYNYSYDNSSQPNLLTRVGDRYGETLQTWTYDSLSRGLTSAQGGSSLNANLTTLTYPSDYKRTVTNAGGVVDTYTFTSLQKVPKVTGISRAATSTTPAMSRTFGFDSNGYLNSSTDWNGNSTTYVNNALGNPTTINEAVGSPAARTTTITYDPTWIRLPKTVAKTGLTTGFTYDGSGNALTKVLTDTTSQTVPYSTNGQTRTWQFFYDSTGHVTQVYTPNNNPTTLTWTAGTLTKISNPLSQAINITAYTAGSYPETVVDANGVSTALTYDAQMRLIKNALTTTAGVLNTTYAYWSGPYLYQVILPDASQWTRTPDAAQRPKDFSDSYGNHIADTLDALGQSTAHQTYNSSNTLERWHYASYDALERILTDTGANSQVNTYTHDHNGNVLTVEDALSHTTTNTFDALNRLATTTDANAGEAFYTYDAHDRPLTVKDKNGNTTTYIYNGFGDMIQQSSPDSGTTVYHYDADSNVTSKTDAASVVTNHAYDTVDRVLTTSYPADSSENVGFYYDQTGHGSGIGRLTSVSDAAGSLSRTYDQRGNILTEVRVNSGNTFTTTYTYDTISHVASIKYPSGATVTLTRDLTGNVTSMPFSATGSDLTQVGTNITHAPFGPLTSMYYGQGDYMTITRDEDYRPTALKYIAYGGTAYGSWGYGYDVANNVHTITDNITSANSQTLGYDVVNRITSSAANSAYGAEAWSYDKNGNVTSTTLGGVVYTQVPSTTSNQIVSTTWTGGNTDTWTYAANGNLTSLTKNGTAVYTPGYNKAGRLVTNSGSKVSPSITGMSYDAFGKRITKTGSATSVYTYDLDGNLIEEKNGSTVTDYIYLDGILVGDWAPSQGHLYAVNFDNRGVPLIARDEYGLTTWEAAYSDPYGTMTITQTTGTYTGPMTENIRLPGQFFDMESSLHQNGQRDYYPALGRYIQPDPIGLAGGLNPYLYANGNPHKFIDRQGTDGFLNETYKYIQGQMVTQGVSTGLQNGMGIPEDWAGPLATFCVVSGFAILGPEETLVKFLAELNVAYDEDLLLKAAEGDPIAQQSVQSAINSLNNTSQQTGGAVQQWIQQGNNSITNVISTINNSLKTP
jgi:RHS repeat-associated protein